MKRRTFLTLGTAAGLSLTQPWAYAASEGSKSEAVGLSLRDPGCAPGAYEEVMRSLHAMPPPPEDPTELLKGGRAWFGGSLDYKPNLVTEGTWVEIPAEGRSIPCRLLKPQGGVRGVFLEIHGGGWAVGAATSGEALSWEMAQECGIAVLSVDYRLAPEHPFPAGPDDCEAVARWLLQGGAEDLGSETLLIGGYSAGAHLAALTLTRLSPSERRAFAGAVLFYGVYDLGKNPDWRLARDEDHPDLRPTSMQQFVEWFAPGRSLEQLQSSELSPLYASLEAMPPALFLVGTGDILACDSRFMAARWGAAGNSAQLWTYPGAPHGFNAYPVHCDHPPNRVARDFITERLSKRPSA